jgi:hypothetical protein
LHWVLLPTKKKTHNITLHFDSTTSTWSPVWLLKAASGHEHACLLPSDTNWKPITSITAVLFPCVTCSLTRSIAEKICISNKLASRLMECAGKFVVAQLIQKLPTFMNFVVHYRVHNAPLLDPALNHSNPIHILTCYYSKINLHFTLKF